MTVFQESQKKKKNRKIKILEATLEKKNVMCYVLKILMIEFIILKS